MGWELIWGVGAHLGEVETHLGPWGERELNWGKGTHLGGKELIWRELEII